MISPSRAPPPPDAALPRSCTACAPTSTRWIPSVTSSASRTSRRRRKTHRIAPFPVLLFGSEYWSGLRSWLEDWAVDQSCLRAEDLALMEVTDDPALVVERMEDAFEHLDPAPGDRPADGS